MKKIFFIAIVAITSVSIFGCGSSSSQVPSQNNNVTVSPPASSNVNIQADQNNPNFDVAALAELVKKNTNPKLLEQAINDPSNNITNLDLDKDGKVDEISVVENGANQLIVSDINVNPSVTVATINITQQQGTQTATMNIQGSPTYCGPSHVYNQPGISLSTLLLWHYLLTPHSYYVSPYHYGYYSPYYSSHRTVVRKTYVTKTSNFAPRQKVQSTASAGNRNVAPVKNSPTLSNATNSQRDFKVRDANKPVGTGGFGNKTPAPAAKPKSSGWFGSGGSHTAKTGGFGGGGRSFGGGGRTGGFGGGGRSFGGGGRSFGG